MTDHTYALTAFEGTILRKEDNAFIPNDPGNTDYREYLAWLDAGNTPEPYVPPPPPIPSIISDRQFFQQAAILGIITQAEALAAVQTGAIPAVLQTIVDGITDPDQKFAATMLLSGATVFERNHPFTEAVGAALGWTSAQVDQFFVAAAQL